MTEDDPRETGNPAVEGTVLEHLPHGLYRVGIDRQRQVTAHVPSGPGRNFIRVLVGDRSNNRIQIFDQDGTFIDQWTQFGTPSGMYVTSDDTLYVVDYNDKKGVMIASAKDGTLRYKLDEAVAEGVAVDADGSIYVGETVPETTLAGLPGGNRVRKFERTK